jgi:hypothetical protein
MIRAGYGGGYGGGGGYVQQPPKKQGKFEKSLVDV